MQRLETTFDPTIHPHRRFNPLTREHVLVSPHRMKRPWQGQTETLQPVNLPQYDPKCYLCPGNVRSGGQQNKDYTNTFTFENDFPALLPPPEPEPPVAPHPLLASSPVHGSCDVLVFHRRHDFTLARLSVVDIERVIQEWIAVYVKRSSQQGIKYVQIFENKGAMNGCSNPHPHGQVWSLSEIPSAVRTELSSLRDYAFSSPPPSNAPTDSCGRPNLLLEYAHFEIHVTRDEGRVVVQNDHWVALVPWWALWPFEILLLPYKRHIPSLVELTSAERVAFAAILSQIAIRYDNLFSTSFPYSMGIHQQPIAGSTADDAAHLHLHFYPPLLRSANIRKFLVGFEQMAEPQRDLTPEQAAKRMRDSSDVHYLEFT